MIILKIDRVTWSVKLVELDEQKSMIRNSEKIDSVTFALQDVSQEHGKENLKGRIKTDPTYLDLSFEGYGDFCSQDGSGSPIIIEYYQGELRIIVWANINQEDPTHVISLEGAKEIYRKE